MGIRRFLTARRLLVALIILDVVVAGTVVPLMLIRPAPAPDLCSASHSASATAQMRHLVADADAASEFFQTRGTGQGALYDLLRLDANSPTVRQLGGLPDCPSTAAALTAAVGVGQPHTPQRYLAMAGVLNSITAPTCMPRQLADPIGNAVRDYLLDGSFSPQGGEPTFVSSISAPQTTVALNDAFTTSTDQLWCLGKLSDNIGPLLNAEIAAAAVQATRVPPTAGPNVPGWDDRTSPEAEAWALMTGRILNALVAGYATSHPGGAMIDVKDLSARAGAAVSGMPPLTDNSDFASTQAAIRAVDETVTNQTPVLTVASSARVADEIPDITGNLLQKTRYLQQNPNEYSSLYGLMQAPWSGLPVYP